MSRLMRKLTASRRPPRAAGHTTAAIDTGSSTSVDRRARCSRMPGDVSATYASTQRLHDACGYTSKTDVAAGIHEFIKWYRAYHNV